MVAPNFGQNFVRHYDGFFRFKNVLLSGEKPRFFFQKSMRCGDATLSNLGCMGLQGRSDVQDSATKVCCCFRFSPGSSKCRFVLLLKGQFRDKCI